MAKKYKVFTPNKGFNGKRNGVVFENGVGRATKAQANELVSVWGYDCPELTDVNPSPGPSPEGEGSEPNGSRAIEPWNSAVKAVKEIDNMDDLKAFVVDEDRDSVLKAAKEREEELVSEEEDEDEIDSDEPSPQPPSKGEEDSDDESESEEDEDSEEEKGSE